MILKPAALTTALWPLRHTAEINTKCSFYTQAKKRQRDTGKGCDFQSHLASWQQSLGSDPGVVTPSIVFYPERLVRGVYGG